MYSSVYTDHPKCNLDRAIGITPTCRRRDWGKTISKTLEPVIVRSLVCSDSRKALTAKENPPLPLNIPYFYSANRKC